MYFANFTDMKRISQEFSELIFTELLEITCLPLGSPNRWSIVSEVQLHSLVRLSKALSSFFTAGYRISRVTFGNSLFKADFLRSVA